MADPVFWFCLLTSVLTLPSAIGNSVAGPEPGLQSFSPGKRFWAELGGERMTALSVLPYCKSGWDVRVTGQEGCAPLPRMCSTYIVLYISAFPTLLSHPSCPRIYLPPPRLGLLPRRKAIFVLASHGRRYESADGWNRSAPVCSPRADVAPGTKRRVGSSFGSSRLDRLYLMLLVQPRRGFHGFGKLVCLLAKPKVPNGNPGLLPTDVVLSVLKT